MIGSQVPDGWDQLPEGTYQFELGLGSGILQPGNHPRQPVPTLRILQHVHLIYDHCPHLAQVFFAADDLVYALICTGDDIGIKALGDLPAPPQPNAADSHPDGGLKSQLPVCRELIELLIGQSHQWYQE